MKVILCEDVINLGLMGETVKVADGYARNYLLPRELAVRADSASAAEIEHQMRIIRKREVERREELKGVAEKLAELTINVVMKAGEGGKLYGSVTNMMIADQLKEAGHLVDRRNIKIEEPIKTVGEFEVGVRLGSGVDATLKVVVEADTTEDEEAAKKAQDELAAAAAEEAADEAAETAERGGVDEAEEPAVEAASADTES